MRVFRSKAGAEVLMLDAHADAVLRALGREPAPQGVFRGAEALRDALIHLQDVLALPTEEAAQPDEDDPPCAPTPGFAQRAWPVQQLLQQALAAQPAADVTWASL